MTKKLIVKPHQSGSKKLLVKKTETENSENTVSYQSEWESMFVLAEHWESDIRFFNDEINFLNKLIAKYITQLTDNDNMKNTRQIADELLKLGRQRAATEQRIEVHLMHLANLVQNPFSHEEQGCKDEHLEVGSEVATLTTDFRNVKKEVFKLTEYVMGIEKNKHLLNS